MTAYGYTPVPGSERLKTRPIGEGPAAELESLDPAVPTGRVVEGEWLARCVVRERFVPVLLDVFDRLALDQEATEQAVYGHLWRLALSDERNWCRVSLKELQQRTRLSERRLNKALAGLVAKDHVRLVERDRRGTLYRVMLPHEVFGEPDGDVVHMPRPKAPERGSQDRGAEGQGTERQRAPGTRALATGPTKRPPSAAARAPQADERPARARKTPLVSDTLLDSSSVGALALAFVERFGEAPGRMRVDVVDEILGLLEDGDSLAEAAAKLATFAKGAPRRTPISDLRRFLSR